MNGWVCMFTIQCEICAYRKQKLYLGIQSVTVRNEVIKEMLRNLYYVKNNCNEFSQIIMYSREKFSWHF